VRPQILAVPADRERLAKEAFAELELDPDRRTVVVFGGSLGALHVNRAAIDAVTRWNDDGAQVLLLTGAAHETTVRAEIGTRARVPVRVLAFLERMELAYTIADLIVARAGAATIAELSVCGVPSLLIPYPYATARHQDANARALERAGGARVMFDDELDGAVLLERLRSMLEDAPGLATMGERARAWSKPEAAAALARAVVAAAERV
jgi:UDP-N-acetylglucosamine--N-acetylmuramyl-(pentapeptide) pyrophosphoryl-undecaprenol N-acetylglucosamine transferase